MILNIPIDTSQPDHSFTLDLEGTVFLFKFRLNSRSGRWIMSIYTELEELIIGAIPLVINVGLIQRYGKSIIPRGEIYVLDLTGAEQEPTETSFGLTHLLVYVTSDDATLQ